MVSDGTTTQRNAPVLVFGVEIPSATGTLTGRVVDATNAPVAGAVVSITDALGLIYSILTDANGYYTIQNINPGAYIGTITKDDYAVYQLSGSISSGQTQTQNGTTSLVSPAINSIAVAGLDAFLGTLIHRVLSA